MISQTAEYALRAIVYLADQGEPQTTQRIAEATRVPAGYLSKVMQSLARGGLVHSQRGLHGGFNLLRPPEKLTVWEVVDAVDPIQRIRTCPLGLKSHGANLCPMHKRLDDAMAMVETAFRNSTVRELLDEPTRSKPLCDFPHTPAKKRS
jgi:Rrf2 family transcriptional regulator, nitric oxide-sensitive transcriptional repressor